MSTITKQWLQQKIAEMEEHRDLFPGDLDDDHGKVLSALRIALASLEAEAVAYIRAAHNPDGFCFADGIHPAHRHQKLPLSTLQDGCYWTVTPLYTAPPVPVSVPDEIESTSGSDFDDYYCDGWNACRAAMLQGAENAESRCTIQTAPALDSSPKIAESTSDNSPVIPGCSCRNCRPVTMTDMRFVVCPDCGNKRCPHANDHQNACTGSNEPGQEGSAYPAASQQEVKNG